MLAPPTLPTLGKFYSRDIANAYYSLFLTTYPCDRLNALRHVNCVVEIENLRREPTVWINKRNVGIDARQRRSLLDPGNFNEICESCERDGRGGKKSKTKTKDRTWKKIEFPLGIPLELRSLITILVRQFPRSKIVAKTCRRFRFPVDKLICCPVEITAERVSTRDNGFGRTGT